MMWVLFAIGAALCWGFYGPILGKGQALLQNPLKALLCVGGAYFLMGVLVPLGALGPSGLTKFTQAGVVNASIGGALGALGAICIIYAFRNGGTPTYVMAAGVWRRASHHYALYLVHQSTEGKY